MKHLDHLLNFFGNPSLDRHRLLQGKWEAYRIEWDDPDGWSDSPLELLLTMLDEELPSASVAVRKASLSNSSPGAGNHSPQPGAHGGRLQAVPLWFSFGKDRSQGTGGAIAKAAAEAREPLAQEKRPADPPPEAEEEKPEEKAATDKPADREKKRQARPHGRNPFPAHLPRRRIEHPADPAQALRACCSDHPTLRSTVAVPVLAEPASFTPAVRQL